MIIIAMIMMEGGALEISVPDTVFMLFSFNEFEFTCKWAC